MPGAKRLGKVIALVAISIVVAGMICLFSTTEAFTDRLIRVQAKATLAPIDARIIEEPLAIQAVLLDYSKDRELTLKAWISLFKYPEQSRHILQLYGTDQEFKSILLSYGDSIIPAIQYFLDNDVKTLVARHVVRTAAVAGWEKLKGKVSGNDAPNSVEEKPSQPVELGPYERGRYAISFIRDHGHTFLGEFVINEKQVAIRIQTQRISNALAGLFTSGVKNLEKKYVLDESINGADVFFATMDLLPMVVSLKLLRAGRVVAATGKELTVMNRIRLFGPTLIPKSPFLGKLGKFGMVVATAYVVIAHPTLLNSLFRELAESLGLNPLLIQFLGWFIIVMIPLYFIAWAVLPLLPALRLLFSTFHWMRMKGVGAG